MTGTCRACGTTFEVSAASEERFPGWVPPRCPSCYAGASSGGRRPSSRTGGGRSIEEHLTLAQVLDRYHDGPTSGVFTDGSSIPNPGPGGWGAAYVVDGEVVAQEHGYDPDTTNNRMELVAIIRGIALVPVGTAAVVRTDSKLAVDTLTQWAAGWERRGWTRKAGPIKNLDLVQEAWALVQSRPQITLEWVKAHDGNLWNEYADALATAWARDEL